MPKAEIIAFRTQHEQRQRAELLRLFDELGPHQQELLVVVSRALLAPGEIAVGPDAKRILACEWLHNIQNAINALYEAISDDKKRDVALDPLNTKWFGIKARIFELNGPTTPEGARAIAMALLDQYPQGLDEAIQDADLSAWLAIHLAKYLTRQGSE